MKRKDIFFLIVVAIMVMMIYTVSGESKTIYFPIVLNQKTPTPSKTQTPSPTTHKVVFDLLECPDYNLTVYQENSEDVFYVIGYNIELKNIALSATGLWQDGTYYSQSGTETFIITPHIYPHEILVTSNTITFTWYSVTLIGRIFYEVGGNPINNCSH